MKDNSRALLAFLRLQKRQLFFLFLAFCVCLFVAIGIGVQFLGKPFPLWYVLPLLMLMLPFSLGLIEDRKDWFGAFAANGSVVQKFFVWVLLIFGLWRVI